MAARTKGNRPQKPLPQPLDEDAAKQVENELMWCIEKLQAALTSNKLKETQAQEVQSTIKVLKSKTAPLAKKRLLMRNNFGDYRVKMAEEEKKYLKSLEKSNFAPTSSSKGSVFVKKKSFINLPSPSDNTFRFNFPEAEKLNDTSATAEECNAVHSKSFKYVPSDNSFRFNFDSNEEI